MVIFATGKYYDWGLGFNLSLGDGTEISNAVSYSFVGLELKQR